MSKDGGLRETVRRLTKLAKALNQPPSDNPQWMTKHWRQIAKVGDIARRLERQIYGKKR